MNNEENENSQPSSSPKEISTSITAKNPSPPRASHFGVEPDLHNGMVPTAEPAAYKRALVIAGEEMPNLGGPAGALKMRRQEVIKLATELHNQIHEDIVVYLMEKPEAAIYTLDSLETYPADVVGMVLRQMREEGWTISQNDIGTVTFSLPVVQIMCPERYPPASPLSIDPL